MPSQLPLRSVLSCRFGSSWSGQSALIVVGVRRSRAESSPPVARSPAPLYVSASLSVIVSRLFCLCPWFVWCLLHSHLLFSRLRIRSSEIRQREWSAVCRPARRSLCAPEHLIIVYVILCFVARIKILLFPTLHLSPLSSPHPDNTISTALQNKTLHDNITLHIITL